MATEQQPPQKKERFAPKVPVNLDPPKDDPISLDYLEKCNGMYRVCPVTELVEIRCKDKHVSLSPEQL